MPRLARGWRPVAARAGDFHGEACLLRRRHHPSLLSPESVFRLELFTKSVILLIKKSRLVINSNWTKPLRGSTGRNRFVYSCIPPSAPSPSTLPRTSRLQGRPVGNGTGLLSLFYPKFSR